MEYDFLARLQASGAVPDLALAKDRGRFVKSLVKDAAALVAFVDLGHDILGENDISPEEAVRLAAFFDRTHQSIRPDMAAGDHL